jgi:RNA polymerase-associated protein RTF1
MSESDSDDEGGAADTGTSDVLFPYENKFYDAEDKRQIMNMPEIQREAILAERALQIERHGQKAELRRLFQNRAEENKASEKKKRKAAAADLDDAQRKSSRPKTKASDTLEEYKRQREERSKGRLGLGRRSSSSGSEDASDADADGDDDVEWDDGYKSSAPKASPIGSLKSFNRARIARTGFAQCCFWPDFEEAVLGCYVRLLTRSEGNQQVYRMVRIKGMSFKWLLL